MTIFETMERALRVIDSLRDLTRDDADSVLGTAKYMLIGAKDEFQQPPSEVAQHPS